MKTKLLLVCGLILVSASAMADEYQCKVNCVSPSGSTTAEVNADSKSEAASIVDGKSDQICQDAGYGKSTSSTMSSSQCWKK